MGRLKNSLKFFTLRIMAHSFCTYFIFTITFALGTGQGQETTEEPTWNPTEEPTEYEEETIDTVKQLIFIICGVVIVVLLIVIGALLYVIWRYGKSNKKFVSFDITNPEFAHIVSSEHTSVNSHSLTAHTSVPSSFNQYGHAQNASLQLQQVYSPQTQTHSNQYQDSITFNSVQNQSIQQMIIQKQEEQLMNASLGTDLPSSNDDDESSSTFSVSDKDNDNMNPLNTNTGGNTTTTTTGKTAMITVASNSSQGIEVQSGTTKGPKLPKPKTKGHWM